MFGSQSIAQSASDDKWKTR